MQTTSAHDVLAPNGAGVRSVSVLSTGTVDIHPQHAFGSRVPMYVWLLASRRWLPPRPINVYVIEHAEGIVLFDTGQDRASVTDPNYFPTGPAGVVYARLARFSLEPNDTLPAQLRGLGYRAMDVRIAILSHLHQDHIGGLGDLPNAQIVVSDAELHEMRKPLSDVRGFLRRHIEKPGLRWRRPAFKRTDDYALAPFRASHDLMGDGSLMLLPTPGHTPGSVSLLVRRPSGAPLLLVGDLTYDAELLELGRIPGVGNKGRLRATTALVCELKQRMPDLVVLPAHDPGASERLRRANANT